MGGGVRKKTSKPPATDIGLIAWWLPRCTLAPAVTDSVQLFNCGSSKPNTVVPSPTGCGDTVLFVAADKAVRRRPRLKRDFFLLSCSLEDTTSWRLRRDRIPRNPQ
ncbi:hypothetical protein BO86DRAFT_30831 [Aspergillus japonicus CBS 114.51]|uniref:Uncharacterized protein n=1 Tax=Aspergillus japonicus CBS 114.51 TaxID=1448312 RepID=A0A8T8WK09_ASPJA|nr:hypothetical protein BO86DRAFT_30831 [Aspergillus japonicus CBS 114.51]RAH76066.1 hypothetical protein BO86DRAFT_30831 [Aspergillus japonicus CBS 114.51]